MDICGVEFLYLSVWLCNLMEKYNGDGFTGDMSLFNISYNSKFLYLSVWLCNLMEKYNGDGFTGDMSLFNISYNSKLILFL